MASIDGGALSFKAVMDNDQMNEAIEETLRRVQGLSDATVAGGNRMDSAFLHTADGIRQALGQIGQACEIHETALAELQAQYEQLGKQASIALSSGQGDEARSIRELQASIRGEISVRKQALEEARNLSDELEKEAQKRERATKQIEENAQAHQSLRGQIRALKEEMAQLVKLLSMSLGDFRTFRETLPRRVESSRMMRRSFKASSRAFPACQVLFQPPRVLFPCLPVRTKTCNV